MNGVSSNPGTPDPDDPDENQEGYRYGKVNVSTVNIRQTAGGEYLGVWPRNRIGIVKSYNSTWYQTFWNGNTAYVMKQYLDDVGAASTDKIQRMKTIAFNEIGRTDPNYFYSFTGAKWCLYFANWLAKHAGFASTQVPNTASTPAVNIRAEPSANGEIIGRLFDGDPLQFYTNEEYNADGYEWYRIMFDGDGYIQKRYVIHDNSNRSVVETYNFNLEDAVTYADNHTQNKSECTNYNNTFGISSGNDCANFISQCLCAGGLPMFDGWAKPVVSAVPSDWNDTQNWIYTNRSRCALIAKNRIYRIPHTDVKRGDIVYTYNSSESPNERYTHVVIVSEAYNSATQKCKVHGHTANQQNQDKVLTENNCRCYRVVETIKREACEVKLRLPVDGGSGATIY